MGVAAAFIITGTFAAASDWPPSGEPIRLPVVRDTGLSSVGDEAKGNTGRASRLKLKSQQEMILLDIDPTPLSGRRIAGALLHFRSASPEKASVARLGVSTVAAPWREGSGERYRPQKGSACYAQAAWGMRDWAWPGSTATEVVFGLGHTLWRFADCTRPDADGWQTCAVEPDVVAARAAGLSYGFCLYDEVGSTWSAKDGDFTYHLFPNRMIYSRESLKSQPFFEIWMDGADTEPPDTVESISSDVSGLPPGEALVSWRTPGDAGSGVLGFNVACGTGDQLMPLPRYLIPPAGATGETVRMYLRDIDAPAGKPLRMRIAAVDRAGNVSRPALFEVVTAGPDRAFAGMESALTFDLPETPVARGGELPAAGGLRMAVIDALDKVSPESGTIIPPHPADYLRSNHLFSAADREIRLQAARNETVAFQLLLTGTGPGAYDDIGVKFRFPDHPDLKTRLYEFAYVRSESDDRLLPDPLVPTDGDVSIPSKAGAVRIDGQKHHSLIAEIHVPHSVAPGRKRGVLTVANGEERLNLATDLRIDLTVWNFSLPDKLSFVPEMNAYGTVSPDRGYDYYRLAHEHRLCMNRLPYGWKGVPGFAPEWKDGEFDWTTWDEAVAPLLDGTAFADLPRAGEPLDLFYLPFNENWPAPIAAHYRPAYWPESAFDPAYGKRLKTAFERFAGHIAEKGWNRTRFQFYLNNKVYYRKHTPESVAPWIFDEPTNTQDFWALRWYGLLWHAAVARFSEKLALEYRADISYSHLSRDMLLDVVDLTYIGATDDRKRRIQNDWRVRCGAGRFAEYGTANPIESPNTQPVMWSLLAWSGGAEGLLPWQTIGGKKSWTTAHTTALFYPTEDGGPLPSIRLKAFRRGQQDVEYLSLLQKRLGPERFTVAKWLHDQIDMTVNVLKSSETDAGTATFATADPARLWRLRYKVGRYLSNRNGLKTATAIAGNGVTVKNDIHCSPRIGYVTVAPNVSPVPPTCSNTYPFCEDGKQP